MQRLLLPLIVCLLPWLSRANGAGSDVNHGRPNILVIFADEVSLDALSCREGDTFLRTPNLDSLAARGTLFTRAYVANPLCVPARTSMLTGRYPHETGVQNNGREPHDSRAFPTLGTCFSQAGYDTGYVGKWHLRIPISDTAKSGFAYSANVKDNGADPATPAAVSDFLKRGRTGPFLLFASFVNPHNICEWARGEKLPDGDIGAAPPSEQCPLAPANLPPQKRGA